MEWTIIGLCINTEREKFLPGLGHEPAYFFVLELLANQVKYPGPVNPNKWYQTKPCILSVQNQ